MSGTTLEHPRTRRRLLVRGRVQGVGFRPFVYRLAQECHLGGTTGNASSGVVLEIEGEPGDLDRFQDGLLHRAPPHAKVESVTAEPIPVLGEEAFHIGVSQEEGAPDTAVMPDLATCSDCLAEVNDPKDRRYHYPFTNCVNCGPRYSIIERLPYDRPYTTMDEFPMCPDCRNEYYDPADRRFHAQPIACPVCGPRVWVTGIDGVKSATNAQALDLASSALRGGSIVAFKSLGGFQLMCDATNNQTVTRLRERKHRPSKPLALMCRNLDEVGKWAEVSPREAEVLTSAAAPIVLLRRKDSRAPCPQIAPNTDALGIMLPYTPLHHLLLDRFQGPIVATSGNLTDEPLCFTNEGALEKLDGIADLFLLHDRPVLNPIDDSVAMVVDDTEIVLRRARGYAPLAIDAPDGNFFAMGADLKNCFALAHDGKLYLSPHHGDMGGHETRGLFQHNRDRYKTLFGDRDYTMISDMHPDYHTSRMSEDALAVQHHTAHLFACMGEHKLTEPVLGFIWDGTGYGTDGTIWGGELLLAQDSAVKRVGRLLPFPLPGGVKAVLEPRRTALGLLHALGGADWKQLCPPHLLTVFSDREMTILDRMLQRGINSPQTSAVGRLFDGIAALLNICLFNTHEAAAPCALEEAAFADPTTGRLPFMLTDRDDLLVLDWRPMVRAMLEHKGETMEMAGAFHRTLARMIGQAALHFDVPDVALAGGCFQNRLLLETALAELRHLDFRPRFCAQVPPGDGGIAVGQIFHTAWSKNKE
ncbi:MAG: carbamoyltransferase HypF [Acidobacteriota bacterium]|nr:carbamoyltransferase HypF [Acidobacteriota bacterium]